jgi:hypothetical protein
MIRFSDPTFVIPTLPAQAGEARNVSSDFFSSRNNNIQ